MRKVIDFLRGIDWIGLGFELGIGLFILISLVRCAFKD